MTKIIGTAVAASAITGVGVSLVFGAIGCYYLWIGLSNVIEHGSAQ